MIYFDEQGEFRRGVVKNQMPGKYDFIKGSPFCHAPCMVRREAYLAVNGYSEDKRLLRVEDYHLWFKMYATGYRGYILLEPLYKMRDDRYAVLRRTYRNRINEAYVKHIGYKMIGLPFYYQIYAVIPILKYFAPRFVYDYFHRK
jgi:glycosyltransferase EpsE